MNKVSGQIEEFFSIGAIWLLFLVNMSKKISLTIRNIRNLLQHLLIHSSNICTTFMWISATVGLLVMSVLIKRLKDACSSQSAIKYPLISPNFFLGIAREENEARWQSYHSVM